jgi:predicted GNAT family acetyltransferase
MESEALAALEHENLIEAFALFSSFPEGAVVRRAGGVAAASSGLPFLLFNQVIVETDDATPDALADGIGFMRERGTKFLVNLRIGADDRLAPQMAEVGLVPLSETPWMPGMALHPVEADAAAADPAAYEVRLATDRAGIEDHVRTGAAGFDMPEELLGAVVVPDLLHRDSVAVYVGYTDGEAVSTGLGLRSGRTIGVYNVATVEGARGRGYAAAMTRRVVADGVAAGCDVAILQSSAMGYAIYERLGFRTVIEYMAYVEPD